MAGSLLTAEPAHPPSSTGTVAAAATDLSPVHTVHRRSPQPVDDRGVPTPALYAARVRPGGSGGVDPEAGSTLPFVLVCWLVAALMVFGAIAPSDAFLKQQQVQSVCDGAALAAANEADRAVVYAVGVGAELPLTRSTAEAAVAHQLAASGAQLDAWSAETDGTEVTVRCTRSVHIAFDWLFLGGQPLERTAVASARAPTIG